MTPITVAERWALQVHSLRFLKIMKSSKKAPVYYFIYLCSNYPFRNKLTTDAVCVKKRWYLAKHVFLNDSKQGNGPCIQLNLDLAFRDIVLRLHTALKFWNISYIWQHFIQVFSRRFSQFCIPGRWMSSETRKVLCFAQIFSSLRRNVLHFTQKLFSPHSSFSQAI